MVNALLKGYQLYDVGTIGAEKKNEPQFVLLKNNDIQSLVVVPTSKDSTTCVVNFVANIAKDHEEALSVATEEEIIRIFRLAIATSNEGKPHYQQLLGGLTDYLIGLTYYLDKNNRLCQHENITEKINTARSIMYENINQALDYTAMAEKLNMSYSSFRKHFKTYTGLSPAQYFLQLKLQQAKILLRTTNRPIKEIAWELDFNSIAYFSTIFKKHMGISPAQYRIS